VTESFPEIEIVVADSAYKTPITEYYLQYRRPQAMKGGHEWWKQVNDEYYDCIICPEYKVLN